MAPWLLLAPVLVGASVATHEAVHCALATAGGATSCTIDLVPGWCAERDMTLTGFCLGSASAERVHAPLPVFAEEVVAYTGGAIPVLLLILVRRHRPVGGSPLRGRDGCLVCRPGATT